MGEVSHKGVPSRRLTGITGLHPQCLPWCEGPQTPISFSKLSCPGDLCLEHRCPDVLLWQLFRLIAREDVSLVDQAELWFADMVFITRVYRRHRLNEPPQPFVEGRAHCPGFTEEEIDTCQSPTPLLRPAKRGGGGGGGVSAEPVSGL